MILSIKVLNRLHLILPLIYRHINVTDDELKEIITNAFKYQFTLRETYNNDLGIFEL